VHISYTALQWFRSYLTGRRQRVIISDTSSDEKALSCGVPQGSVLGPLLFTTYTQPLQVILADIDGHFYADDSQLYLAFQPRDPSSRDMAAITLQECYTLVKSWMSSHFLKLNDDKTEVLVITTPSLSNQVRPFALQLGESTIEARPQVRNLGVTYDSTMKLEVHVKNVCRSAYHQLHSIYRIRRYLTQEATKSVVHAYITSRLDYCNSLLIGLPQHLLNRLQRVQYAAVCLVTGTPRTSHITPVLNELHWLPVSHRILFKVGLLTYKALHGLAPVYLTELLKPYSPARSLRSGNQHLLEVPRYALKTYGGRSFSCMAPVVWNNLPLELRSANTVAHFKSGLKTHLFRDAYKT
jgi:hypothetical protein